MAMALEGGQVEKRGRHQGEVVTRAKAQRQKLRRCIWRIRHVWLQWRVLTGEGSEQQLTLHLLWTMF